MMKLRTLLLAAAALVAAFACPASAQPQPGTATVETVTSTGTCSFVQVSTFAATSVLLSTSPAYRFVDVQNIDPTSFVACGYDASISTWNFSVAGNPANPSGTAGWQLKAGGPGVVDSNKRFPVLSGKDFFCLSRATQTSFPWVISCRGR